MSKKITNRARRHRFIRTRLSGTTATPRLAVFRSNRYLRVQLIDDTRGRTLSAASTEQLAATTKEKVPETFQTKRKLREAFLLGQKIGEQAKALKVEKVCFDRGGYRYAGRVLAAAEGARAAGLKF